MLRRRRPTAATITTTLALLALLLAAPACEGDGGGDGGSADVAPQLVTRTDTATLGLEEGLVFATGALVPVGEASVRNVDLLAFAHGDGLKLESGTPDGAMHVPRRGGRQQSFDALVDVPDEPPEFGVHDLLVNPDVGHGCVVRGNVTNGHARIRVTAVHADPATGPQVTFEYEAFWWE